MMHMVRLLTRKPLPGLFGGLLALLMTVAPGASALAADNPSAAQLPVAVIAQPSHTVAAVMEGIDIKHDFIIENRGPGVLEIRKVQPD